MVQSTWLNMVRLAGGVVDPRPITRAAQVKGQAAVNLRQLFLLGKALELNYPVEKIEGSPVLQDLIKDGRWQEKRVQLRK